VWCGVFLRPIAARFRRVRHFLPRENWWHFRLRRWCEVFSLVGYYIFYCLWDSSTVATALSRQHSTVVLKCHIDIATVCLSVCLSVTFEYFIKAAEQLTGCHIFSFSTAARYWYGSCLCLSVCHVPVLYLSGWTSYHIFLSIYGSPPNHSLFPNTAHLCEILWQVTHCHAVYLVYTVTERLSQCGRLDCRLS